MKILNETEIDEVGAGSAVDGVKFAGSLLLMAGAATVMVMTPIGWVAAGAYLSFAGIGMNAFANVM